MFPTQEQIAAIIDLGFSRERALDMSPHQASDFISRGRRERNSIKGRNIEEIPETLPEIGASCRRYGHTCVLIAVDIERPGRDIYKIRRLDGSNYTQWALPSTVTFEGADISSQSRRRPRAAIRARRSA